MPDRKPSGSASPVPAAKPGDVEDVSWALSTAEAMWGRGDRADALKWVRRAAEAASEAEDDDRALEIAKAAADLAGVVDQAAARDRPEPSTGGRLSHAPATLGSGVSPAPAARPSSSAGLAPTPPRAARTVSAVEAPAPARTAPKPSTQSDSSIGARERDTRKGRKSAYTIDEGAKTVSEGRKSSPGAYSGAGGAQRPAAGRRPSATSESRKPRRSTIPPPPTEDPVPTVAERPSPPSSPPPSSRGTEPHAATSAEIDAWPTQALEGDALSGLADEMTRIGTPAFVDDERPPPSVAPPPAQIRPSQAPQAALRPSQSPPMRPSQAPGMRPSQAMRVIVWRGPDGVHVAPQGTTVSAITVDALLVALDPSADLASWLVKK